MRSAVNENTKIAKPNTGACRGAPLPWAAEAAEEDEPEELLDPAILMVEGILLSLKFAPHLASKGASAVVMFKPAVIGTIWDDAAKNACPQSVQYVPWSSGASYSIRVIQLPKTEIELEAMKKKGRTGATVDSSEMADGPWVNKPSTSAMEIVLPDAVWMEDSRVGTQKVLLETY